MYHSPSTNSVSSTMSMKPPTSPTVYRKRHPEAASPTLPNRKERHVIGGASNKPSHLEDQTSPKAYREGEYLRRTKGVQQFPNVKPSKERLLGDTGKMRSVVLDPSEKNRESHAMDDVRRRFDATWAQREHYDRVRAQSAGRVPDSSPIADDYWPAQPQSRFAYTNFDAGKELLKTNAGTPLYADDRDRFTTSKKASDLLDVRVERQVQEQKEAQKQKQQIQYEKKSQHERRVQETLEKERSVREQAHFEAKRLAQAALHQQYLEGVARREQMQSRLQAILK